MGHDDSGAALIAAMSALVTDLIWVAACDYHAAKMGEEPTKAHKKWLARQGFESPLEEIEAFWSPNRLCRLYISLITDAPPEMVCAAIKTSDMAAFSYRQKVSVSSDIAENTPWGERRRGKRKVEKIEHEPEIRDDP